ncbi:Polyadenylate-binding protein-interacting protein 13 [Cardamine amara subsp. amara]|uniref:Polyadenylate-binding protein-interacting protein 13 n=1 Tax=Cardamine amara subsp. amara TaxID=228776 RepID=A0ABD1BLX6_CARAN
MAVTENGGVKVDSFDQNSDNNTASLTEMKPPCNGDQTPNSNSYVETPNPTEDWIKKTSEVNLKSEISHLNPMAKEFFPSSMATRTMNFDQGKQRMNKSTNLAQNKDVIRRTVYVADIDQHVTEEQLASLFLSCGQIVDCRICGDHKSILRFAFIEFTNQEGAMSALRKSGTLFGSHPLKVHLSKTAIAPINPMFLPKSEDERKKGVKTIYCTNIDKKVTRLELEDFFKTACGEVHHLRLLGDCHHQTRIAFIEFKLAESAISALNYSGVVLGGLPIRVSPSKTPVRPQGSSTSN